VLIGNRIGTHEVVATFGERGMGEVYRAGDSRLKREVALKVLPSSVAQDADRLARFQREAEVLATRASIEIRRSAELACATGSVRRPPRR
jgi:hypothetical protein